MFAGARVAVVGLEVEGFEGSSREAGALHHGTRGAVSGGDIPALSRQYSLVHHLDGCTKGLDTARWQVHGATKRGVYGACTITG